MTKRIVGLMGFKGSGKDAAAHALLAHMYEWQKMSFAHTLKQTLCVMFGWEYEMMEGITKESREWREQVDVWWAVKLGIPHFTPRFAMTHLGTDVIRKHFADNLWILSLQRQIDQSYCNVVITDCRYPNEAKMIKDLGGELIYVRRGQEPAYYQYSKIKKGQPGYDMAQTALATIYAHVHSSEWAWNNLDFDHVIENDGTVEDLHDKVYAALGMTRPVVSQDEESRVMDELIETSEGLARHGLVDSTAHSSILDAAQDMADAGLITQDEMATYRARSKSLWDAVDELLGEPGSKEALDDFVRPKPNA